MNSIITRFAPSPTGNLHIGSVRTALINYIITQKSKKIYPDSKFLLRIEDTDKQRSKKEFTNNILSGLKWININYDEDIVVQSQNIKKHQDIAYELLKKNKAFKCICTSSELEEKRKKIREEKINDKKICKTCANSAEIQSINEGFTIRIKAPVKGESSIKDLIQGSVTIYNKEIDDFIILRKDGTPTYMLSVVVDDYNMGVNLIIRGDDHLNNVFRQNIIYENMGWNLPQYAHLPLIHGEDGRKLSKRHGSVDINEFKIKGYLKESIINNLILLGWSPNKNNELIEINEIIDLFELENISKSASIFNYEKLNFFNNHYIKNDVNYVNFLEFANSNHVLKNFIIINKTKVMKIFDVFKNKLNFYEDLENIITPFFNDNFQYKMNLLDDQYNQLIKEFLINLEKINNWDTVNLENTIKKFIESKKIKFATFGKPTRLILVNSENGPSISDILYILGKKNSIERIKNYIIKI